VKRVLVVSPSFPPISAADLHRVRMSLPHFRAFGWEPYVLAIAPEAHGGLVERELISTVPADVVVERTGALPEALTRLVGVRNPGLRAWWHLYRAGSAAIRRHAIDLAYFSTTMFPTMCLGRLWKARLGTPYVLDMQDTWRVDYTGAGAQRGLKASVARSTHAVLEPFAMRAVDGIVSVSPAYAEGLRRRYARIREDMCTTIPFGVSPADFDAASRVSARQSFFDRTDGRLHAVGVGRGGRDMAVAATILFRAFDAWRSAQPGRRVCLTFVGTDYASRPDARTLAPVAESIGLGNLVREFPARVPYLEGLRLLADAHVNVILGSDDAAYSPSKVYPYLLSGRPFVAVMHEASPVVDLLRAAGTGVVVTFGSHSDVAAVAAGLARALEPWLARVDAPVSLPEALASQISARELTRRQCLALDLAVRHAAPQAVPCVE